MCRSRYSCSICKRRHHLTLHLDDKNCRKDEDKCSDTESKNYNITIQPKLICETQAILPTAMVIVNDRYGNKHRCRALLDSGSQSSFISENCIRRLNLQRIKANINVTGITASSTRTKGKSVVAMTSIYDSSTRVEIDVLVLNNLPSKIPECDIDRKQIPIKHDLQLADPDFHQAAPIDLLIGAERFFAILKDGNKQLGSVHLQNTIFGWVVSGIPTNSANSMTYTTLNLQPDLDIDKTLRKFWEMEEPPQVNQMVPEDQQCEVFYTNTVKRHEDGRYVVQLPFQKPTAALGDSLRVATRRFLSIERKMSSDERFKQAYVGQMREYIEMGHMLEIPFYDEKKEAAQEGYYLPHHAVYKSTSETTKMRVVFDGSSKTSSGLSLNDIMMVGPTIQPNLWSILVKFRCHRVALTSDIEKMYRQVIVAPDDTKYQKVLWRENGNEKIRHFKLTRVTFGLSSSAYLAIRTLQQLAKDSGDENVLPYVLEDFYVDDFLSGTKDKESAIELKQQISSVLQGGGFTLRKWRSNLPDLCDDFNKNVTTSLCDDLNETITILGLHWHPFEDMLTFRVNEEQDGRITKRKVISEASRVFDPLGFISPSIIILKTLLQRMWLTKIDWDDDIPNAYKNTYNNVRGQFKYFEAVKIPRFTNHYERVQIHGFSDASEIAYCAVIYSRSMSTNGEITTTILTSKTKVAPLKKVSIPRMELCAAYLLAKLMDALRKSLTNIASYHAWTDSNIVLAWLSSHPTKWKTFVGNRTSQILDILPRQHWSHVKSNDNPADHGSRGVTPQKLVKLDQWWYGPAWLKQSQDLWPSSSIDEESSKMAIEKEMNQNKTQYSMQITTHDDWLSTLFERKSNIYKVFRVIAYINRFIKNLRIKEANQRNTNQIDANEMERARIYCIKWVQANEFSEDIQNLKMNFKVSNRSRINSLAPFIDDTGILRVGGRLQNSDCDYDSKHPVILPADHIFTGRLISKSHAENLHSGPTLTNIMIRQKYWIINGRSKIRGIIKKCVVCVKHAQRTSKQLMGNLPTERVIPTFPFTNCGIDFAGPIYFATKKGRGATNPIKGYICIFVCLSVKAIHIEPVSDLTSEAFLATLKRFIARRGVPKHIYTDNGSNFIGARRILAEAYQLIQKINNNYILSEFLSDNHIEWHFIPPSAPHFGGLWESAVKSVKTHLLKTTNNINLTFEEMSTLMCQIENILNSRPLYTTASEDDYDVLTPAHFLIGTSAGSLPEKCISMMKDSLLTRWERVQNRVQIFWHKYQTEYLNSLQQRNKWKTVQRDIHIDDVVIIKESNAPICRWLLGRVIELHPGADGLVRVVTVKTASSILQRPIVKICKLPVD